MTDQISLFRGPLRVIKRRWVKVGGGFLFSENVGMAAVQDGHGNEIILESLYVPKLGVNLVSGRKLCFDFQVHGVMWDHIFYFLDQNEQPVLEANVEGGIYVISRISGKLPVQTKTHKHDAHYGFSTIESAITPDEHEIQSKRKQQEYVLWHRRFAHAGPEVLRSLHKITTLETPVPIAVDKNCPCEVCALTKMRKMRGEVAQRKKSILDLVSIDICGPIDADRNGKRYFLHIIDNYSRKRWSYSLISRTEAPEALEEWKLKVELETDLKLRAVRLDNAPELMKVVRQWERRFGILVNPTEAYNSIQNGSIERAIQTAENDMRALLKDAQLPNEFWTEALQTGVYLRNRTASGPEVDGQVISPEEGFTGVKPSVDHLRTWGCKMYSYVNSQSLPERQDKLMDRGRVGVFLGYVEGTSKQYKMWAPDMKKVIVVSLGGVRFNENETVDKNTLGLTIRSQPNSVPIRKPVGRPPRSQTQESSHQESESAAEPPIPRPTQRGPVMTFSHVQIPAKPRQANPEPEQPKPAMTFSHTQILGTLRPNEQSQNEENQSKGKDELFPPSRVSKRPREEDNDDESDQPDPKMLRAFTALLENEEWIPINWFDQSEDIQLQAFSAFDQEPYGDVFTSIEWGCSASEIKEKVTIPETYDQAVNDPVWGFQWKEAVDKELRDLSANSTWEVTVPPKGANLVTSKWVFSVKYNIDGAIEKFKARLVARSFSQKYGVDFEDTFAPTLRHDTLRLFFAVVCLEDLECHQVDVNNAFTESMLKETIYMKAPLGVKLPPGQAFHLLRSLYGLKQAARDWNQYLIRELIKLGFIQSEGDPCLLIHPQKRMIVLCYVDDIAFAAKTIDDIRWFKQTFGSVFKIKDLGEVHKILGVRVVRDRQAGTLRLDQTHYIKDILARFSMNKEKAHPTLSPMDSYDNLRRAGPEDERTNQLDYVRQVGS